MKFQDGGGRHFGFSGYVKLAIRRVDSVVLCLVPNLVQIIRSCRRALTRSAAVTMVYSFIVSRIDYCNSLLAACSQQQLDKLQRVLNCAARVI